ncbi:sporulation histidine kinase inhibitor Sda [Cohnella ginsengisoli]|uniref:Sporulation histidine kinase inhibitor Sda n=1 Tax=Cohnella ginsengisoli TaxID=425004 RepID=A0A9X4QPU6_9BACL|nr:sporulation histidine kinase inhibitor Sda [Cohnella ginsengisoli]MDG0789449.1 sporulation histidine kinase inhibitor Sda [Cohnella ginsengisoli]MDG0793896.1 sporulation histidine kinase inhibitor Sda [Cohnella ginsengisoli]
MKVLKESDDAWYVSLAVQTVLQEQMIRVRLNRHEILNIAEEVQLETLRFKEAAELVKTPSGKVIPQMRFILAHLQDDHLASSYFEARSLGLDAEFVQMLRCEIIRRGIKDLVCEDLER